MSIFSSYKKIFLLGFIIIILIAIPFSVYIAQQRQRATTKAAASTTLSFDPASPTIKADDILTLNVVLDPGSGALTNQVSFVKLSISFDSLKFTTVSDSLTPNPSSPNTLTSILEDPVYEVGKATISLSIGADPTKVLTTKAKIAVLKLKALSPTDSNNPTSITFDKNTQVLSIAASDQTSENVLSTTTPASITINPAPSTPASTSTSTSPATPTATATPSPATIPSPSSITTGTTGLGIGTTAGVAPIIAPQVSQALPTAQPPEATLPPTGPGENILGIGILGAIFIIIGGALFILL